MKIYNVLVKPGLDKLEDAQIIVVEEAFSIKAFVFQTFWLLYHKLWLYAIFTLGIYLFGMLLVNKGVINDSIFQGINFTTSLAVAIFANSWYVDDLKKKNYSLSIITANNIEEAKLKYYKLIYEENSYAI